MSFRKNAYNEWVLDGYVYAARWINQEWKFPDYHFELDLAVAPDHPAMQYRSERCETPILFAGAVVDRFVVDTGASLTVLKRSLADALRLPIATTKRDATLVGNQLITVVGSEIHVNIGHKWQKIPCVIPDDNVISENLLGLKGLFEDHMFCMDKLALTLFRR